MLLVQSMPMDSQSEMQDALQYAIQLEHATIPPYLTALYSLKPGTNEAIAGLMKGIVFQEMQHMTLAANMLTAASMIAIDTAVAVRLRLKLRIGRL